MADVTIRAPAARSGASGGGGLEPPSPEELCRIYYADIQRLKRDLRELGDTTSAISSVALGLLKLLVDMGVASETNTVTIPRWLHTQMLGASIKVGETASGDVSVQLREQGRERVVAA